VQVIHLSATQDNGEARVHFPADEPAFAGHFPKAPVLPGVVLIDTSVILVGQALGRPLFLKRLDSVKFVRTVAPGDTLDLVFTLQRDPDCPQRIRATARWIRGGERISEMSWTAGAEAAEGMRQP
jgi:3-hydroxymyristoyl/3-hydroxydecanoyl-(acyl carrier protein) dehydratase